MHPRKPNSIFEVLEFFKMLGSSNTSLVLAFFKLILNKTYRAEWCDTEWVTD